MKTYVGKGKKFVAFISAQFAESALMRFAKRCYDAMFSGFFGSILTNYSSRQKAFKGSMWGGSDGEKIASWRDTVLGRARRRAIVSYENSRIILWLSKAGSWLMTCHLKMYGFFLMYFGLCTLLMNLIKRFALSSNRADSVSWYIGTLLVAASLPLLLSGETLTHAIDDSLVFSRVVYNILGFSRVEMLKHDGGTFGGKRYFAAAAVGSALGVLTFRVSPIFILVGLAALVAANLVYRNPEIGMLGTILITPFLSFFGSPSILLAACILITLACTAMKAFLGRLVVNFEISDLFVALFMLVTFLGGLVSFGGAASFREAALYVCLLLGYFVFVALISSREWLERCTAALVISGVGTALYGIYQLLTGNLETETLDKEMFADIGGRVTSTFDNANMLGVFLIMVFPFALGYLFRSRSFFAKLLSFTACCIMGICLIFTWSRGAWIGLVFACFIFVLLYSHYILPVLIPTAILGVTVLWNKIGGSGLFTKLASRFSSILTMSDSSSVYRLGIWRGAFRIIDEYWLTGIGIGSETFRTVYIRNAESGIETAVHSHNLFLQLIIETGVIGLIVFIIAVLMCVKSGLETVRYSSHETSLEKAMAVAGISGLAAAMLQGMTDYIWFNYRIYFVFFLIAAVISASSRIARKYGAVPDGDYGNDLPEY